MRDASSPAAPAAQTNCGFTIMEMLFVLVLLIAFMFVSAPVMREILVTMRAQMPTKTEPARGGRQIGNCRTISGRPKV